MTGPQPPRLPRRLLEWIVGDDPRGSAVLGDLHEEYVEGLLRGRWQARLRYWLDTAGICGRYLTEKVRRRTQGDGRSNTQDIMDQLILNTRYSLRRLAKAPGFSLIAVLSLGLGIGANTAIFSLVNAVILREVPYEEPESLVDLYERQEGFSHSALSYPDYVDVSEGSAGVFAAVSGMQLAFIQIDGDSGIEMVPGEAVTGNYFSLIGVDAAVGRLLSDEDHVSPGAHPVVVLGHGFWQRRFAGNPDAIGTELRLAGRPYTVIGVVEESYPGGIRGFVPDIYVPIMMHDELQGLAPSLLDARGRQSLFAKARLEPGVSLTEAEGVVERIGDGLRELYPDQWTPDRGFVLVPTADVIMNPMVDRVVLPAAGTLMGVVGLVLLIACANLASFLLARAADRRKEIAVRLAMGARRRTLVGQLLTETILLSALGGVAGVAIASWSLRMLVATDLPLPFPITLDLAPDATVLGFSLLVSLAAGLLFGLAPAIQGTNPDLAPTLRDERGGGGSSRGIALRNALVVGQVAVSMVLLLTGGLFLRSLNASRNIDPGFGADPTGVLDLVTTQARYSPEESTAFVQALEERIAVIPGVEAVGVIDNLMLNTLNTQNARVAVDGVQPPEGQDFFRIDNSQIDEGFLDAAGIPLLEGRTFSTSDDVGTQPVVLVNETFALRFFPGESAVGRTIRVSGRETLIVGVTRDTKVRQLGEEPRPYLFESYRQGRSSFVTVLARTSADAEELALRMLDEARALDPEIMVTASKTVERHLATMLLPRQLGAMVISGFAVLALMLASIGLYGVVSYAVARRSREVGIRLSLGAESGSVVWMLTSQGMKLVALGGLLGVAVSALVARFLSTLLYGIGTVDPFTFTTIPLVMTAVALAAAWIPARRASRVDPVVALRSE